MAFAPSGAKMSIERRCQLTDGLRRSAIYRALKELRWRFTKEGDFAEPAMRDRRSETIKFQDFHARPRMEFRSVVPLLPAAAVSWFRFSANKRFPFPIRSRATIQWARSPRWDCRLRRRCIGYQSYVSAQQPYATKSIGARFGPAKLRWQSLRALGE